MGQRLNIELFYNGERVANAYYHWSGYTSSAFDLTRQIIINYDKFMSKDLPIQIKAILLLQTTRAGLMKDEFKWAEENINQFDEYKDILINAANRSEGLISISQEGMDETEKWEEARVTIHLDTKKIDLDTFYIYETIEDYIENYSQEEADNLNDFPYDFEWGYTFEEFMHLDMYYTMAWKNDVFAFKYQKNKVIVAIE
jgi:hypothetical protein